MLFAAMDLRYHSFQSMLIALVGGGFLAGGIVWLWRRGAFRAPSRVAIAFAALSLMIYPKSFVGYRFVFPGYLPEILAQPGVQAVYSYSEPETVAKIPSQIMFMMKVPGTEVHVLGPQKPYHQLVIIDRGQTEEVRFLEIWNRGSDNAVFDPHDRNILYIGAGNNLHRIDLGSPRILESLKLDQSFHNVNFIHYDVQGDRLFLSEDAGNQVFVVDRKTFRKVEEIPSPSGSVTDDVWIDPVGHLVLTDTRYFLGRRVDTYDRVTLNRKNTYFWPLDYGFNFGTLDPEHRRAFLASTLSGEVRVLDLDTLEPVDSFRLAPGIRNLNFDPLRRWVVIGNYFRGLLHVYDLDKKRILGPLFLGSRLRWVEVDSSNDRWYATSSVGGFEITPDRAFPSFDRVHGFLKRP